MVGHIRLIGWIFLEKGNDWSWSRDKNFDEGRRFDKNHLRMVMGGASTELKRKFQGTSCSKSFM